MLDLETVHGGLLGNDRLQQQTKCGNVPLTVAEGVEQRALRLRGVDFKRLVEGAAGRQHAELLVEDEKRLGDRIDYRLRKRLRILDIRDGLKHGRKAKRAAFCLSKDGHYTSCRPLSRIESTGTVM